MVYVNESKMLTVSSVDSTAVYINAEEQSDDENTWEMVS